MANKIELPIEFLANLKTDKSQLERISKEIEAMLSKISPNIDFDSTEIKNGLKRLVSYLTEAEDGAKDLEKILASLDVDLDADDAKKSLAEIEQLLGEIDKTDLSELERTFNALDSGKLDENIAELEKALGGMDDAKFNQEVEKLAASFQKARQETVEMIEKQRAAQQALKAAGKEGTEAYNKIEREIADAEAELKKMGAATEQTSSQATSLGDKFAKFGMISMGIEQITSSLNRFQEPFIELDKQTRNIGTLGVKNFKEFADAATELSKTVPDSAAEIAQGVYDAISAGTIKVKDGMADVAGGMTFVETASKLATAGLTSTKDAVNGLTSVMNAYGAEASEAAKYSDILFGAVNVGKTTIPELNASMAQVVPEAAKLNISFTNVAATLATMTKQGVPTAQATTQLRAAFVELQKPGAELTKVLNQAGLSYKNLETDGPQETFRKLALAIEATGKPMAQFFGSIEASSAVTLLAGKNAQMAADDLAAVAGAVGSTDAAFAVASEGIGVKSKTMMNQIQAGFNSIMGSLGTVGQTALSTATQVAPLITSFAGLSNLIPTGAVARIGELGKSLLGKLVPALAGATAGQGALNAAMMVNPYVLAIAGVAALAAGLYFLFDALHQSAAERKEELEAEDALLDKQIETNKKQQEKIEKNKELARQYEELGSKVNRTAEEDEKYRAVQVEIAKAMPGVIDRTKSFTDNLDALKNKVSESGDELKKLQTDMDNLKDKKAAIKIEINKADADIAMEEMDDMLTSFWTGRDLQATKGMKQYVEAMKKASSEAELDEVATNFKTAIFQGKEFTKLSTEEKAKFAELADKMQGSLNEALVADKERNAAQMKKSIDDMIAAGTDVDDAKFQEIANATKLPIEEVKKYFDEAGDAIKKKKLGDAIKKSTEIEGKIKSSKQLQDLVEQYNKAGDEIEKAKIGAKIKAIAPDAVEAGDIIKDANGDAMTSYNVLTDKVNEAADAEQARLAGLKSQNNTEIIQSIEAEGAAYDSNFEKLQQLQEQINNPENSALKDPNTEALQKQFDELNKKVTASKDNIIATGVELKQNGLDTEEMYEQLAKSLGKSPEEVKKLVAEQEKSIKATKEQTGEVKTLGQQWDEARKQASEAMAKNTSEYVAIIEKRREILKKSEKDRTEADKNYLEESKSTIDNITKETRKLAAAEKQRDKDREKALITTGQKEAEKGKTALELAKQDAETKVKKLDIEQQYYEYVQKESLLTESRKADSYDELVINQKQLETIKSQRLAWIEALKARKLITEVTDAGEIVFNAKISEPDKTEILSVIQDYNGKIQDEQSKIQDLKIKLKADDIELQTKLKDLEQRKIEWEISIGIKSETALETFVAEYKNKLAVTRSEIEASNSEIVNLTRKMEEELSGVSGENSEQEQERIRIRYELKLSEVKSKNFELQQTEFETMQSIAETEDKIYQSRLETIKANEEARLKVIDEKYSKQSEALEKFNQIYAAATEKSAESDKDDAISRIEDEEKAKLAEIQKWQDEGALSAEEFERRKAEIEENGRKEREAKEEEFRRKQLRAEAVRQGTEAELQRRKDAETLKAQKEGIEKQLKLLETKASKFDEMGKPVFDSEKDVEAYKAMEQNLADAEKTLQEKGTLLGVQTKELQTTVTDSLTNLFAGDPDAAADGWRKFFSQLAGMLQAKASAFVLDLVLSKSTTDYLMALPFPLNVVAIPAVTATVSAAVKAITDPVISAILSFSTGGRIDQPTMAIIGDASRLGGRNREWIFNDSQLQATVQMASAGSNSQLIAKLDRLEKVLASQELTAKLKGQDILLAQKRTSFKQNLRAR